MRPKLTCMHVKPCLCLIQLSTLSSAPDLLRCVKSQPDDSSEAAGHFQSGSSKQAVSSDGKLILLPDKAATCHDYAYSHMGKTPAGLSAPLLCRSENELREQRRLMEAVRGILTSSVQSSLGPEQQAFLQNPSSWEPPAPTTGATSQPCHDVS